MTELKDKVRHALNEGRILILGVQVLLGFCYRSVLETRFEHLPARLQWLSVATLGLLLVAFGLLVAPAAYHRIVDRGAVSSRLLRFATLTVGASLLPLALALGVDTYIAADRVAVGVPPPVAAAVVVGTALACWYVIPLARGRPPGEGENVMTDEYETSLEDKIDHVLTEIRMVLPGAQALLGFGFAAILMESFDHLPQSSQLVHLGGIGCVTLATILLMTPASRHRIAERGEDTEDFHRFTSRVLLVAMGALALGVAAQVLVVVRRVHDSLPVAVAAAVATLVFCFGLWFGVTVWLRARVARGRAAQPRDGSRRKAA